ncbi:MAG: site-specific integrase [Armatimonadota bacterium]
MTEPIVSQKARRAPSLRTSSKQSGLSLSKKSTGKKRAIGSIESRGIDKDGFEIFRVIIPIDKPDGTRGKYYEQIHGTSEDAEALRERLLVERRQGTLAPTGNITLTEWAKIWLHEEVIQKKAPGTARFYRHCLEMRILPELGKIPLNKLQGADVDRLLKRVAGDGMRLDTRGDRLSTTSHISYYHTLSTCLQEAVYRGLIPLNPVRQARPPRLQRHEAAHYDEETTMKLVKALDTAPARLRLAVLLAAACGLRRGEVIGLQWGDIDLSGKRLVVRHSAQVIPGAGMSLKVPKSGALRPVPLPALVVVAFKAWQKEQAQQRATAGAAWHAIPPAGATTDLVFTDPDGTWYTLDHLTRNFTNFITTQKLPGLTFHGLRHTYATLAIGNNLPVSTVSALLGHSQSSTTLNIYTHADHSSARASADMIDAKFTPSSPDSSPNSSPKAKIKHKRGR